ncbi:MAG: lysylphosphatidylglycerol synthase domain-containing protein [Bacilli bacterium]|nr:lysylphosphatidylglycerol synthase domain-containing protein [Bacilli bacterium]MDD3533923.1 lysylphosphatidylglycerol synthase domain-containing protein [Candidatus Cloacimonadota bacterium]
MKKLLKGKLRYFTNTLIVISLIFLVRYLLANNLLRMPDTINWYWFAASLLMLAVGYGFDCFSWLQILRNNSIHISMREAIESVGIAVFGKYIPGKVWVITGMSGRVSQSTGAPIIQVSLLATLLQVLNLALGAFIGLIGLTPYLKMSLVAVFIIITIVVIVLFFGYKDKIRNAGFVQRYKFTRKWLPPFIRSISPGLILSLVLIWISWSISFYLLAKSLGYPLPFEGGFVLPLGSSAGTLLLLAPGGLGVREGALGLLLAGHLTSPQEIVTLSAFSRLWFLVGEIMIFLAAGLLITLKMKRTKLNNTDTLVRG